MGKDTTFDVLVALPMTSESESLKKGLESIRKDYLEFRIVRDRYQILEEIKSEPTDLLIVSPIILSDPLVPLVRTELGLPSLKIVAFCTTLLEEEMCQNFDGKILNTESYAEMVEVIEGVLAIGDEEELLTPREKDVVIAVVKGLTNKEIAEAFFLSPHTIITHRRNIARKLNIHSASGLTIYAIMNKLVSLDEIKDL